MASIPSVVVGYGVGRLHCRALSELDGFKLVGLCDIDPHKRKQAEKDFNIKGYRNIEEVCDDKNVELVVVATPHDTHASLVIELLNAGKHTIVEKVMCLSTQEAEAMIRTARRNDRLFSVFQNRRWDADYLTVKLAVEKGLLGRLILVESTVGGHGKPGGWRAEKRHGGGMLYDWGAHLCDQCLQLMGYDYKRVMAYQTTAEWEVDVETYTKALVEFSETLFVIELTNNFRHRKPRWFVCGERGHLRKESLGTEDNAIVATEIDGMSVSMELQPVRGDWLDYYRNIRDVFIKGANLAVKPEEALECVRLMEDIRFSAEKGIAVSRGQGASKKTGVEV